MSYVYMTWPLVGESPQSSLKVSSSQTLGVIADSCAYPLRPVCLLHPRQVPEHCVIQAGFEPVIGCFCLFGARDNRYALLHHAQ